MAAATIDRDAMRACATALLESNGASRRRRAWARDVLLWLDTGDAAAARRLGMAL